MVFRAWTLVKKNGTSHGIQGILEPSVTCLGRSIRFHHLSFLDGCSYIPKLQPNLAYKPAPWVGGSEQAHHTIPSSTYAVPYSCTSYRSDFTSTTLRNPYIHRQSFPLAVPAATQSLLGWKTATAGTAVMPPPPSCANCSPFALYRSTKRFMLPMQSFWTPS
jgi:hypothetical protein